MESGLFGGIILWLFSIFIVLSDLLLKNKIFFKIESIVNICIFQNPHFFQTRVNGPGVLKKKKEKERREGERGEEKQEKEKNVYVWNKVHQECYENPS